MPLELQQRATINGHELAWDEFGGGPLPDLVLLHGYTGSAHDFVDHVEHLSTDRRVLVVEHRGHGQSTRCDDHDDYRVAALAQDCATWIEQVSSGPVDLLGHSMGGRIALDVTLNHPELVRSLMLMDTTAWSFGPDDSKIRDIVVRFLEKCGPGVEMPEGAKSPEAELLENDRSDEWLAERELASKQVDPHAVRELGIELFGDRLDPVSDRLSEISVPTTVIVGEHDHPYVDDAPRFGVAIDGCNIEVINGAYHSPQNTHVDDWRAAVATHLAR